MTQLERLQRILSSYESVLVAFSGGVDSAFVLKIARETLGRDRAKAVTAESKSLPARELEEARALVRALLVPRGVARALSVWAGRRVGVWEAPSAGCSGGRGGPAASNWVRAGGIRPAATPVVEAGNAGAGWPPPIWFRVRGPGLWTGGRPRGWLAF
jgi:hypothetical protein